jgi:flagellar hook-associated protein 2
MELGLSGLASGFDWRTLVDQLAEVERAPQRRLLSEQDTLNQRNNAYGSIKTQLGVLLNRVKDLASADLFDSRITKLGDDTVATASAGTTAAAGSYTFTFTQLATQAEWRGTTNIGAALSATDDVSGVTLSSAGFAATVTAGTFTVNGQQVTIATTDTLQGVFDKISTATGGAVTASYTAATDKITLSSGSAIVLGSATDTSNFLEVAKLYNNGNGTVASASTLGAVRSTAALASSNLATAVTDGGAGAGAFKINGVSISFNATTDSLANVLKRINDSSAGVTAFYDSANDRVVLRNKNTGDVGIAVQDVTGNFLAATGLSGGSLERGKNLLYSINSGPQLTSVSNTITEASSGIAGLTVTALKEDTTTVEVASDTAKIRTAITAFLEEYNKSQSLIDSHTASTTDAKGKVTAGILAGEPDAFTLAARLRGATYTQVTGLSGAFDHLADLGIDSNGTDNNLELADGTTLDEALANNLSDVRSLFTDATKGLAVDLESYLDGVVGEEGSLVDKQDNLTKAAGDIDTQISDLERQVEANRQRLIDSFVAMERAQAQINQQLQFLLQRFGTTS